MSFSKEKVEISFHLISLLKKWEKLYQNDPASFSYLNYEGAKNPLLLLFVACCSLSHIENLKSCLFLFISLLQIIIKHYVYFIWFFLCSLLLFPFHLIIMTSCNTKYSLIYWIISYKDCFLIFCLLFGLQKKWTRYRWKVYRAITP